MKNIFSAIVIILLFTVSCEQKSRKPNIIIILADDAGYADFGFMNSEELETPNLDELAKEGVVFTDAHTSASVCSPSRAGLLTGRYQQRFGHEHNSPPVGMGLDTAEITIGTVFKENGYNTAIFGKWHVGDEDYNHPNKRGFDEFYGFIAGHRSYFPNEKDDVPDGKKSYQHNGKLQSFEGYITYELADRANDFIRENKDNPFLAFLSFNAVHTPMQATEDDLARYEGHPRQKLAAMTWAMDKAIGNVLEHLDDLGLRENTIVYFFSDNGGPSSNTSSNKPLKASKGTEFEGGHRVPFIMSWPGQLEGDRVFDGLTSTLDVFSTSVAAAKIGKTNGKQLDGVNLIPFLKGEKNGSPHDKLFWRIMPWRAARLSNYKLLVAGVVDTAFYELNSDIGERNNLMDSAISQPYLEKAMIELKNWEEEVREPKWYGEGKWKDVKKIMYVDHINNLKPRVTNPWQLKEFLKSKKE